MSLEDDSRLNAIHVDRSSHQHKPRICLNILAAGDRPKCNGHPVVRSQSSRAALLRQPDGRPPASACSVTSGAEVEHFPLPDKYVEYRSSRCRISRWILSTVFLVTTAISLWLLHIYGWIAIGGKGVESKMCLKPACIKTAARLLSRLDASVDPCTDFYKFTCGKFLVSGNMPDDAHHLSTLHEMQDDIYLSIRRIIEETRPQGEEQEGPNAATDSIRKAQQLYASCMNPAFEDSNVGGGTRDHPLHRFLTSKGEIGAWPLLQAEHWAKEKVSLERLMATLAAYQVHSFFDLYLSPDEKNTSTLSVQIYKGDSLIDKEWFEGNGSDSGYKYGRYLRAYRNLVEESVLLLSRGQRHLLREVDDIINFEAKFAKVAGSSCSDQDSLTRVRRIVLDVPATNRTADDAEGNEQRYTLSDIQEQFPSLNWTLIMESLLESVGLDGGQRSRIVTEDMVFSLQCQTFLSDMVELLHGTPKRTVVNYLVWRFLFKMMPYIGTRFHRLMLDFKTSVPNLSDERLYMARWKHCVHLVNEGMGLTLAHLYISREAPLWSISKQIQELIQEIKQVFGRNIAQQEWIEDDMKQRLLDKLKSMGSKIGFPSRVFNAEEMDREYQDLVIRDEHILFNVARLRKHEVWREVKKIFQPETLKEKDWLVQPLVVNAFHNTGSNEIIFPLGILREPLYHPDYPKYVLYGNLGVVIGHELIHGFDENGRRYDHLGNLTHWWSESLLREFRERADCFVQQYNSYPIDMIGKNVDGNITLGENICDSAGMAHAWSAYKNTAQRQEDLDLPGVPYTHDQLFFITYGQIWCEVLTSEGFEKYAKEVHSPGKYRAIGVLQNSDVFSSVFNCPLGSPMNPHTKCKLWS